MALQITITDAGRAEVINADNTGTGPVTITEVGLGTGQYNPDPEQLTLTAETKRLNTIAGQVVSADIIHVTIKDETGDAYTVNEFGLYTDSGTLFAVYSDPVNPIAQKASASALLLAVDITLGTLNANSLTFGDTSFAMPPASETVPGVMQIASFSETKTGTNNSKAVTPAGLQSRITESKTDTSVGKLLKVGDFGNGGPAVTIENIDAVRATGTYIVTGSTTGVKPTPGGAGILIHYERGSSNQSTQFFDVLIGPSGTTRLYVRTRLTDGQWAPWFETYHSGNLTPSDFANVSDFIGALSDDGWQPLAGGLIFQWGSISVTGSTSLPVIYPIVFPNGVLMKPIFGTENISAAVEIVHWSSGSVTNVGFSAVATYSGPASYFVLGY